MKTKRKQIFTFLILLIFQTITFACPVCERNQPKLLRGIVHGSGPDSNWDYVSIGFAIVIAIMALVYSVKWLWNPNENDSNHIKFSIFK